MNIIIYVGVSFIQLYSFSYDKEKEEIHAHVSVQMADSTH